MSTALPAKRARNSVPLVPQASKDAKRMAAVILEVWAGLRTPQQAAVALSGHLLDQLRATHRLAAKKTPVTLIYRHPATRKRRAHPLEPANQGSLCGCSSGEPTLTKESPYIARLRRRHTSPAAANWVASAQPPARNPRCAPRHLATGCIPELATLRQRLMWFYSDFARTSLKSFVSPALMVKFWNT